jgi:hypothetical protein
LVRYFKSIICSIDLYAERIMLDLDKGTIKKAASRAVTEALCEFFAS